jgi:hypothetical protein
VNEFLSTSKVTGSSVVIRSLSLVLICLFIRP